MKPGKPLTFAKVPVPQQGRSLLVFGLPGNPVSSLVTFHLAVVPCIRKMEGWQVRLFGLRPGCYCSLPLAVRCHTVC